MLVTVSLFLSVAYHIIIYKISQPPSWFFPKCQISLRDFFNKAIPKHNFYPQLPAPKSALLDFEKYERCYQKSCKNDYSITYRINLSYILIVNKRFLLQKGIDTVFFYVYNQTILFVGTFFRRGNICPT